MQNNWVDPKWEEEQVLRIAFSTTPQWLEEVMAWVHSVENVQKYKELFLEDREP